MLVYVYAVAYCRYRYPGEQDKGMFIFKTLQAFLRHSAFIGVFFSWIICCISFHI